MVKYCSLEPCRQITETTRAKARKRQRNNNSEQKNKPGRIHNNNINRKKKKNKIISRSGSSSGNSSTTCGDARISLDHETIATELLSRLPVKSLMRFKCVCKHWRSFIEDDPYFMDLHLARSKARRPGLFACMPLKPSHNFMITKKGDGCLLLTADLLFPKDGFGRPAAVINTTRESNLTYYEVILGPVNGLICFFARQPCYAIKIYNVSTREEAPWIESAVFMKEKKKYTTTDGNDCYLVIHGAAAYQFGFDPVTKEHKVVFIWSGLPTGSGEYNQVCEVLTVGDNTWRIIDECPPFPIAGYENNVYANGSIYWYVRRHWSQGDLLVVFDIGSEKFRSIRIPGFTSTRVGIEGDDLVGLDAGIALLHKTYDSFLVKMWIFDDHDKKLWSNKVTITLPFLLKEPTFFHSVTGTDQIIIETSTGRAMPPKEPGGIRFIERIARIYSYNWKRNTMKKVDTHGISSAISVKRLSRGNLWRTFVESLLPVRKTLQHHHGTHPVQAK